MSVSQGSTKSNSLPLSCFTYAAGHEDEGICLLMHLGEYRILLDCGLSDLSPLLEQQPPADLIFCSHAHADHCRGLRSLQAAFPQIPIYTSEVTAKLLKCHWLDELQGQDISWCEVLPWRSSFQIAENLEIELVPAGHLPGAAAIIITYRNGDRSYRVMYSGDFSVSNFQLVEGMSIEQLRGLAPDVLIVEGSYGTMRHPHRRLQEKQLMERVNRALEAGQDVLLPVPPIGLGQEILKLLRSHHQFTGRDLDIWVDDSVALTCDIYLELLSQFPLSVQNFAKHQALFWDERICPRMRRVGQASSLSQDRNRRVFLVDYRSDLRQYIMSEQTTDWLILLPEHPLEYISPNSAKLELFHSLSSVTLETYLLAEHSDGRNTTQLIHNLRPQHVILVHGSLNYLLELASLEELCSRYQIHSPSPGTLLQLPIGDRFIRAQTPHPMYYEGELNEVDSEIAIMLPDRISQDSRWKQMADTGIIQVRWQGNELVIKGVSQRELLNVHNGRISADLDCCDRCCHYHKQHCWNQFSPLHGFKVIPEGYCPVFEANEDDETDL